MDDLIGLNAYARHRGCAANAVTKAIRSGRIKAAVVYGEAGKFQAIRWQQADVLWAQNTDPVEAAKSGQVIEPPVRTSALAGELDLTVPAPGASKAADGDQPNYNEARTRTEHFRAAQAELDYLKALGLLVSINDVEREMSEILSQVKSSAMRLADRKAQILAAESDPMRVHRILSDELRTIFDECSKRFTVDAAEGAAQPAPAVS